MCHGQGATPDSTIHLGSQSQSRRAGRTATVRMERRIRYLLSADGPLRFTNTLNSGWDHYWLQSSKASLNVGPGLHRGWRLVGIGPPTRGNLSLSAALWQPAKAPARHWVQPTPVEEPRPSSLAPERGGIPRLCSRRPVLADCPPTRGNLSLSAALWQPAKAPARHWVQPTPVEEPRPSSLAPERFGGIPRLCSRRPVLADCDRHAVENPQIGPLAIKCLGFEGCRG